MKVFLFLLNLFIALPSFSQIVFEKLSFSEALSLAQRTRKLVLLQFESIDCEMCNYVALEGMNEPQFSKKVKESFIALRIDSRHPDRNLIGGLYDLNLQNFGTFFVDGSQNLIHRYDQSTSLTSAYDEQLGLALYNYSETMKLNVFAQEYEKFGTNNKLEEWIWARTALNLKSDSLLNVYAQNLSDDSKSSKSILTFLANQAPLLASLPDQVLRNSKQFDSVWYAIPLSNRIKINRRIISKSMQKAILGKDQAYAAKVANFAWSIYGDDKVGATNSYYFQWVRFFEGTKNISGYMPVASYYYDSIVSANPVNQVLLNDSIQKIESAKNAKLQPTPTSKTDIRMVKSSTFVPTNQFYTNFLNQAAWFIYINADNEQYLKKALEWATLANQYSQKFEAMDTEARILYKLGDKETAVRLMETAVQLKNKNIKSSQAFSSLDIVLKNMKENKTIIDVQ